MNILMFVPLGFLIGGWKGIIICFIFSCLIELTQYIGCLGFCELDDMLNNTIGAGIGALVRMYIQQTYYRRKGIIENHVKEIGD